jgi:hypothetical protein
MLLETMLVLVPYEYVPARNEKHPPYTFAPDELMPDEDVALQAVSVLFEML